MSQPPAAAATAAPVPLLHTHPGELPDAARPAVLGFWADYCAAVRLDPTTPVQAWCFGDGPDLAHELVELVLHGPKRATAGLADDADTTPGMAARPGGYSVVTEFDGTPRAVIRTTSVERRRLSAVDAAFAWDEGEGDRSLGWWLDAHRAVFAREMARRGLPMPADPAVDLERFELLYPFGEALSVREPRLLPAYVPGAFGDSLALQTQYYAREHGFGAAFEAGRLADMADFLARHDPARDGIWLVALDGRVQGSLVIDAGGGAPGEAQLRWFIVSDALRGRGLGRRMMQAAMRFCDERGLRVHLSTFAGLDAARMLYEAAGFRLVDERQDSTWGVACREQRWQRDVLDAGGA